MTERPADIETMTSALKAMDREITRLTRALEIIAGRKPPYDYLAGPADVAIAALDKRCPFCPEERAMTMRRVALDLLEALPSAVALSLFIGMILVWAKIAG